MVLVWKREKFEGGSQPADEDATKNRRLEPSEIETALSGLGGWIVTENETAICRDFVFADFRQAFAFMSECALVAERLDHHPDWNNSFARVGVSLSTHAAGGITSRDVALAAEMDRAAGRFGL
ncbi:4a-hydroxytetrahydrobiopterin dehydratase [Martelella alba]|uniref:Putative pterin-4-alpha-carbinolamine dehydratase n=1 Tax=Martelella alba TaxID=2590451 RepID=A0A506U3D7_9HYPH|nr:4a-hydroxytetrahydrobiopterin dehydratase [Martelella alba]TPW27525.1 4a-hydroxytetrahydrobiopterin dehydratase [Martelella alba]